MLKLGFARNCGHHYYKKSVRTVIPLDHHRQCKPLKAKTRSFKVVLSCLENKKLGNATLILNSNRKMALMTRNLISYARSTSTTLVFSVVVRIIYQYFSHSDLRLRIMLFCSQIALNLCPKWKINSEETIAFSDYLMR